MWGMTEALSYPRISPRFQFDKIRFLHDQDWYDMCQPNFKVHLARCSTIIIVAKGTLCCQCQRDILCSNIVVAIQVVQPVKKKYFGFEMNAVFVGGVLGW